MTEDFFHKKQRLFDRWAPAYDIIFTTIFYQSLHKRLLEYIEFPEFPNILDLGCGTGRLLNRLGSLFPKLHGTGFDFSPEMLAQARNHNRYPYRINYTQGNVESLPFTDNKFDAVFNTISFLHYPNPETVFSEVKRVLHPGGYYYLVDYTDRWATEPTIKSKMSPGGIRFYSPIVREDLGKKVGLNFVGHHYLLGAVLLTIFQK
jgi:ubiquinone/menaquinone biosynthesis C-methylase UbiE